ncbi:MAG: hypothetical protein B6D56_00015 [Candidatus Omnitrophica bacterium 4484_70.1]|nr:MAG: hypothetical protein B6D56_00015 [Candidatus Omnitrophica bacterium 4484_70.1]
MKEELIYLLDVDYKNIERSTKIILYGRDRRRRKVAVIDASYQPHFYVLVSDKKKAKEEIEKLLKKSSFRVEKIEETRKIWRKEATFLKIVCPLTQEVYKIRDLIKSLEAKRGGKGAVLDEFEYQLSFYRGYLAEKGISGVSLLKVKGEERNLDGLNVDTILEARTIEKVEGRFSYKVLSFDIEVVEEDGERKIVMISFCGEDFKKVFTYKRADYPSFVEVLTGERELLFKFVETIKNYDPDIIVGYNSDGYDFEVIKERASKLKVNLGGLSWDNSGIVTSRRAKISSVRLKGRVHIDVFNFINNILSSILQTEVLTLDAVAGEILGDKKIQMEYQDILDAWHKEKNLEKLASYCLKDAQLTFRLLEVLLPQILELTHIVGQTLFDTSRMMYSQLVEWFYTKWAKKTNRIIPNQPKFEEIIRRQKETYIGGYVKEPIAGIHNNIAVIDFASLYPSIISTYNVSLETLNCSCCKDDGFRIEELGIWFCRRKRGFESQIIEMLLKEREELKRKMKKIKESSLEYHLLDNRQKALKIIANASYGYYAFGASKWYSKECAQAVTWWGRFWIKRIMEEAEKEGFLVIYGDTDSAFLGLEKKNKDALLLFLERLNRQLPGIMKIELEDFYRRGIFIPKEKKRGAKKRYALISERGRLKIRGLEKVRRDWSNLAKNLQEKILRLILKDNAVKEAVKLVKTTIKHLKQLQIDLKDLVVYEQITKPLGEYKLISPHVSAAKKLEEKGIPVGEGSVIGFVIKKGGGSISEKAYPVEFIKLEEIDIDYYIYHQILPASLRILKVLGVKEEDILD